MTSLASTSRQRFFSPKYTQYSADGFGRDTYIGYNNGGFLDKLSKLKAKDNFETFSINRHFNTKRNVAPFKYRSDGSGRDNYVLHEHAGLERDYKGLKSYHLKDFLRKEGGNNVNFLASPTKEGIRPKTLYISKKAYSAIKNMKILEKNLEERLYKPKDVHSKEDLYKVINFRSTLRTFSSVDKDINNNKAKFDRAISMNNKNYTNSFNNNTKENFSNINDNNENSDKNNNNNKKLKILKENLYNISNTNLNNNKEIKTQITEYENFLTLPQAMKKYRIKSIDFSNKEKLKEFFGNKQKINQRLNTMFKKSKDNFNSLNSNNSVGQRVLIKNQKGTNIEDRFSKTNKVFY